MKMTNRKEMKQENSNKSKIITADDSIQENDEQNRNKIEKF